VVAATLAVVCKEDAALAVAGLGILVWIRGNRKVGLTTVAACVVWYGFATRVLIPWTLGGRAPFYESWFPELGRNAGEVMRSLVTRPRVVLDLATRHDRLSYYARMLVPVALLALVEWRTVLLLAGPALAVNALSVAVFTRDYRYHYSALVVAGLTVAAVEAVATLGRNASLRRFWAGVLAAVALASTVAWGPSPVGSVYRSGIWPLHASPALAAKRAATHVAPPDAVLGASYTFVPHLDHRPRIYQFPEPWYAVAWGIGGKGLPDPAVVQWLVVDRRDLLAEPERRLFDGLLGGGEFEVRYDQADIVVAQRVRPPA
jgi:hypothetical protein